MNAVEREIAKALAGCTFLPASWDKRFAKAMAHHAEIMPDVDLSEPQAAHLLRLTHKYRRQLPTRIIELGLDEMERRAQQRVADGLPALPDFRPRSQRLAAKRRADLREEKAERAGPYEQVRLPLFEDRRDEP